MRGHRHRRVSPNVEPNAIGKGGAAWPSQTTPRRRGAGARAGRAPDPEARARGTAPAALHVRQRVPAARLRRARRLPPLLRRPARHRRDGAQGRPRRRPDGGAVGRRQPPLRPGLRPLDPLQHHHRCRRSASSATSSPRPTACSARSFDKPGAARRPGRVRRRHRLADAAVRRQRPAVGPDRRRRPRAGDVPAQRARASSSPASRWPCSGSPRFGFLTAYAFDESAWPALDWTQAVGLRRRRRGAVRADRPLALRAPPRPRCRSSPAPASAGSSARGAAATSAPATSLGVVLRHRRAGGDLRRPLRARHRARRPEATAHRSALPRLDLRHAGAGVHRRRAAGPADPHDLPLVPQPQRHRVRRVGQLPRRSSPTRTRSTSTTGRTSSPAGSSTSPSPCSALGILVGVVAGRRTSQPFERGPSSLGPILAGFFVLSCAILASIRGTIFNNIWWVIVVTSLATVFGLAVAVLADRAQGRERGQVVDLPPDGDLVHRRRDHLALHVPGPRSLAEPDRA